MPGSTNGPFLSFCRCCQLMSKARACKGALDWKWANCEAPVPPPVPRPPVSTQVGRQNAIPVAFPRSGEGSVGNTGEALVSYWNRGLAAPRLQARPAGVIPVQASAIAAPPASRSQKLGTFKPRETKILKMPAFFCKLYKSYTKEENNLKKK